MSVDSQSVEAPDAPPPPPDTSPPTADADSVVDAEQELPEASETSDGGSTDTGKAEEVNSNEAISREQPLGKSDSDTLTNADEHTDDNGTAQTSQDNDGDAMLTQEQEIEPSTADSEDDDTTTPPAADDNSTPPEDDDETTPPVNTEYGDTSEPEPADQPNEAVESGEDTADADHDDTPAPDEPITTEPEAAEPEAADEVDADPDQSATTDADEPKVLEIPQNNPQWDKRDPADRARIQDQVENIREQIREPLDEAGNAAWQHVQDNWTEGAKYGDKYQRAISEEGKPEHLFKGIEAHRHFDKYINENGADLVPEESGYRLIREPSYDSAGIETHRGALGSVRPDLVLQRLTQGEEDEFGESNTWQPVHVWDYKTGMDTIRSTWASAVESRIDPVLTPETVNPNLNPPEVKRRNV